MQYLGVDYSIKHTPKLDPGFIPFGVYRILLGLALIVYFFMWKTPVGFKMRAAGASDRAARYGGIGVSFYLVLAMVTPSTLLTFLAMVLSTLKMWV